MFDAETTYWWFQALHDILIDALKHLPLPVEPCILDAGCGTGQNLVNIRQQIPSTVVGFDFSAHAIPFWQRRNLHTTCCASINEIPFPDNTFDVAMSIDVLESDAVNEQLAYAELWRVTKPGGYIILNVPAYPWLMTEEHHQAVHASRRYIRKTLKMLLQQQPVDIFRLTHVFASVFPAVAGYRLCLRAFDHAPTAENRSEIRPLPGMINKALYGIMCVEALILKQIDLPFGSSIMAVVSKNAR